MNGLRLSRLTLAIGLSVATTSALAGPQNFQSARSFAMGGTGVAVAHPASAGFANPAMLASDQHEWADDFGLIIPSVNARFADEEETIDQIDDIQDTIDRAQAALDSLNAPAASATANELRQQLQDLNNDTVRVDAGLGLALAFPMDAISVGVHTAGNIQATVRGEYDSADDAELAKVAALDPTADLNNLQSRARVLAASVAEVGISLAHAYQLNNGQSLQIGVTPKYMQLMTYQYTESVSGFDDSDYDNSEFETDKSGFNLDLGAAMSFGENGEWNAGVAIKNLIPMELDSAVSSDLSKQETQHTLEVDPRVTVGLAHSDEFHVITAELDLTEQKGFGYADDTQWLAVGAEFDAWRYAQIRGGIRHNLASNDDNNGIEEDTQFTAGIGLNPFGARLDIAALYSEADLGAAIEFGAAF
ncbi:conjugal transfer protein TraF [Marinobacter zhejiangensis]|uniref:Plasmid transfer operon, TraF, protein n=1 Tax=Marinobacter zhejiangensis TaxID=488535 RepID=A0A1I4TPJ1_9GAMM|nr:conjugal transfer protein TraF [Marinobacter zhejiangensis]SFM78487.1 plasmid transfer operon, TraF, protein [Marinobacter zhejiangensis]